MSTSIGFRGARSALSIALVMSLLVAGAADARRGGSFGSRGYRTYSAPRATSVSPGYTAPVQRSMTDPNVRAPTSAFSPYGAAQQPSGYGARPGFFHSFGGGMVSGLLAGGLIGAMSGHGFGGGYGGGWGAGGYGGGGAGVLGGLFQLAILALIAWLVIGWFRRRRAPAMAFDSGFEQPYTPPGFGMTGGQAYGVGGGFGGGFGAPPVNTGPDEVGLTPADHAAFERLLADVQTAFAHEDYAALRNYCTPEIVSYLSEELSQNATHGRKNDVSNTRLLQADLSEAWREPGADYATVAMRYESIDITRDRQTGAVIEGDPNTPTQTTELWTFVRRAGVWKLSAIQET